MTSKRPDLDETGQKELAEALEEYRRGLVQSFKDFRDLNHTEAENLKSCEQNVINYSTAADHVLQQIKVIDERNMESALNSMDQMGYADLHGAEAMLTDNIDFSFRCIDEAVDLLGGKIERMRQEYMQARNSSAFIDDALKTNYMNLKNTYLGLMKDVERRSAINDKQWIDFERECREWQVSEMTGILNRYQDPQVEEKYKALRKEANKRLSDFVNTYLHKIQQDLKESEVDLRLAHDKAVYASVKWKNSTQLMMEEWLSTTIDELNDIYNDNLDKYRNIIIDLQHHIYSLEMHNSKLNQLAKMYRVLKTSALGDPISKRKHYTSLIHGTYPSGDESKDSGRNWRHPLSIIQQPGDSSSIRTIGGQDRSPAWTLSLGSRMYELGRRVGISTDELALMLQGMLYDLPDSEALNERLALVCGVYNINVNAKL